MEDSVSVPERTVFEGVLEHVNFKRSMTVNCTAKESLETHEIRFEVRYAQSKASKRAQISLPLSPFTTSVFHSPEQKDEFELTYSAKHYRFRCKSAVEAEAWIKVFGLPVNEYDLFLSYHQTPKTQDTVMSLYYTFDQLGYRTFFDRNVEGLNVAKMAEGVIKARAYLLFLSTGVFSRDAVQLECKTAIKYGKPIVTVYDRDSDFNFVTERNSATYKKFCELVNADKANNEPHMDILNDVEAEIIERAPKKRQVMVNSLLSKAGLPDKGTKVTDLEEEKLNTLAPPPLSENYVKGVHEQDYEKLTSWLIAENPDSMPPDLRQVFSVGISGPDGVGKSYFVNSIIKDPRVVARFPDGLFWLSFNYGNDSKADEQIAIKQAELGRAILNKKFYDLGGVKEAREGLAKIFAKKSALIVLDNVGSAEVLKAFDLFRDKSISEVLSKMLVTVRDLSLIENREKFGVLRLTAVLPDDEALLILQKASGKKYTTGSDDENNKLHSYAIQIIRRCRSHPMALALAGKLINSYGGEASLLQKLIEQKDLFHIDDARGSVSAVLSTSLASLDENIRDCYWDLGIFARGYAFTADDFALIWQRNHQSMRRKVTGTDLIHNPDAELVANRLVAFSLLTVEVVDMKALKNNKGGLSGLANSVGAKFLNANPAAEQSERRNSTPITAEPIRFYYIHDLQNSFLRDEENRKHNGQPETKELHKIFVKNVFDLTGSKPWEISRIQHSYVLERLSSHLALAGDVESLKALAFSYDWLKCKVLDQNWDTTTTYIDDLRRLKTLLSTEMAENSEEDIKAASWLQRTIYLSIFVLNRYPTNAALAEQLWNRLFNIVSGQNKRNELGLNNNSELSCMGLLTTLFERATKEREGEEGLQPIQPALASPESSLLQTFEGHSESIRILRMFEKESYHAQVVSASYDQTIRVWDVENGKCNIILNKNNEVISKEVVAIAMYEPTAVDTFIVSGSLDGKVVFWNADNGTVKVVLNVGSGVRTLAINLGFQERHNLAVGLDNGEIRIYDIKAIFSGLRNMTQTAFEVSVEPLFTMVDEENMIIYTLEFFIENSANAEPLLLYGGNRIHVKSWNLNTNQVRHFKGHKASINRICSYEPSGWVVSCSSDCTIKVWKVKTRRCVRTLGTVFVDNSEQKNKRNQAEKLIGHSQSVRDISLFTPKQGEAFGEPLVISVSKDQVVIIWDLKTGDILSKLFGHTNAVYACASCNSSKGPVVLTAGEDRMVKVWELSVSNIRYDATANQKLLANKNFKALAVSNAGSGSPKTEAAEVLSAAENVFGDIFDHFIHSVYAMRLTPNKNFVVGGSAEGKVKISDTTTYKHIATLLDDKFQMHSDRVRGIDVISLRNEEDCNIVIIASCSSDKTIKLWEFDQTTADSRFLVTLTGHSSEVRCVHFVRLSDNLIVLFSGSRDHQILKWSQLSFEGENIEPCLPEVFGTHADTVYSISTCILSTPKILVSGSYDTNVCVWNLDTGLLLRTLKGHSEPVRAVAIAKLSISSNPFIFSASVDTFVKVWDYTQDQPVISTLKHRGGAIRALDIIFDENNQLYLTTGTEDRNIKVWDIEIIRRMAKAKPAEVVPSKPSLSKQDTKVANVTTQKKVTLKNMKLPKMFDRLKRKSTSRQQSEGEETTAISQQGLIRKESRNMELYEEENEFDCDVKIMYSMSETLGRLDHPMFCGAFHTVQIYENEGEVFVAAGSAAGGIPIFKVNFS